MKITGLTTRLLAVDAAPRYGARGVPPGRPHTWHFPLVIVHTDAGIDGYSMGYGNQGDGRALAALLHDAYFSEIVGENPLAVEALWNKLRRLQRNMYAFSDAPVGILDVAFWDILGKTVGQPIAVLLGQERATLPSYQSGFGTHRTADELAAEALQAKADGYHAYKLKYRPMPEIEEACIRMAREAVGDDYPLMRDAVAGFGFTEALAAGRVLDDCNYLWFEEPIPDRHMGNLRELARSIATPVVVGETLRLDEMAEFVRQGALDIGRGDVYMKAGITGLRKSIALCELFGLKLEIHTMATPLLDVANLHVACATACCDYWEVIHPVYRFGFSGKPLDIDAAGYIHLPSGPGLGVELDWDWIDANTVELVTVGEGHG